MGVSWVFRNTSQNARSIELIFEQAGAVLRGVPKSFRVDSVWYRPQSHIVTLSAFIINASKTDSGNQQNRFSPIPPRATADKGFELQLEKFQSAGLSADVQKFELVGNEYQLKDFFLRVGTVTFGPSVMGVIVELEFAPSNIVCQCQTLLLELMELLFPDHSIKSPEVFQRQSTQPDNYTTIDTLNQYLEIFLLMRK